MPPSYCAVKSRLSLGINFLRRGRRSAIILASTLAVGLAVLGSGGLDHGHLNTAQSC